MISLDDMTSLARALVEADDSVRLADEELKAAKERARILREETIPGAMQELGIEELKLSTGQKLSIKQEVYASIPAANKYMAFDWLTEHGFGGLIKVEVITQFGKGELHEAEQLAVQLRDLGLQPMLDQSVHPQTLKAFIKEQLASGANFPLDMFGARPVFVAKITN